MTPNHGAASFTRTFIEQIPLVPPDAPIGTQRVYYDQRQVGLRLVVGKRKKTLAFIGRATGRAKKEFVKLGEFPIISLDEARRKARALAGQLAEGTSLRSAAGAEAITLRDAWDSYKAEFAADVKQGERSATTLRDYEKKLNGYLADWMDEELVKLGRDRRRVRERHQQITDGNWPGMKSAANLGRRRRGGRAAANSAMRTFRAIYRRMMREDPDLPEAPTINVKFHKEKPREAALDDAKFREVVSAILTITDPIRRDYWILLVFSGLRRTSAAEIRWRDVNLETGVLHIPNPKGGTSRKFDLPLSSVLRALFLRRKNGGAIPGVDPEQLPGNADIADGVFAASDFVFPVLRRDHASQRNKVVHLYEPRTTVRRGDSAERTVPTFPHALRHTFNTNGLRSGVHPYDLKLLLNHAKPASMGDMSMWYYRPGLDALQTAQQRITDFILSRLIEGERS